MKVKPAFLKLLNKNMYRANMNENPMIIGVMMVNPDPSLRDRPCFHVMWEDGESDYVAMFGNYEIVEERLTP